MPAEQELHRVQHDVGVPAVAVPTGVVDAQPLGVQLIGPMRREDVCLTAAAAVQARCGTFGPVRELRVAEAPLRVP